MAPESTPTPVVVVDSVDQNVGIDYHNVRIRPIRRILVANRGEIARRVIRTAHRMGLQAVAIHSDPDAGAPFVRDADLAVAIGGRTSAESYLVAEKVLDAARRAGADAIHPGYGFLSENPVFARAVADAGLAWIGPTPESMNAMALKVEAKRLVAAAGVPLVPGAELAADASDADITSAGAAVGLPLLVKASAGGGGKGMRLVREPDELLEAVSAARNEAASAFGDPTVFLERYLERGRHVEVQVFGDTHGSVVHLFERECSIQRRHQKVVEESPSPGATPATLERMYAAAVAAARAIDYVGAGTVEFMVAGEGETQEFFFLEMNTRLQVEHPVTEEVTGLDLVEWQVRVAAGEPLPLAQAQITRSGHAIEVRLYAEDPARGYLPGMGRIVCFEADPAPGIRVESGVQTGSEVSAFYDPMLAKVIAHGPTREVAAATLATSLEGLRVAGGPDQPRVVGGHPALAGVPVRGHHDGLPRREPRRSPCPSSSAASWRCTWWLPHSAWPNRSARGSRGRPSPRPAGATSRRCPRCAGSGTPSSAPTCRSRCTTPVIAPAAWTSSWPATGSGPIRPRLRSRWGATPCVPAPRRHSSMRVRR